MKKHIVCYGDSNTHGYCADRNDTEDRGVRFTENERWTCLLQKALGDGYLVSEEGLSGRTTCFEDPLHSDMSGLKTAYPILKSHEFIDLLIIMLGTNDTKERFHANPAAIGVAMQRLIREIRSYNVWGEKKPNILIIAPPPISEGFHDEVMGEGCREKSLEVPRHLEQAARLFDCAFMDANGCEMNPIDHMHLTAAGHKELARRLTELVPTLLE